MNELVERSIKDEISILYDMETNNYLMERAISKLDKKINSLGKKGYIPKPVKRKFEHDYLHELGMTETMTLCATIGAILGALIGFFTEGFWSGVLDLFIGALISGFIGIPIYIITYYVKKNKALKEIDKVYTRECLEARKKAADDARRVKRELEQKKLLIDQKRILLKKYEESRRLIPLLYDSIGIDEKFRNLIAMGYMNEFIRLGISTKLSGTDGLYYLIMQELRWDQMQYTLTEISNRLSEIIDNQRSLYRELVDINAKCDRIVRDTTASVEKAERNNELCEELINQTQIATYAAERAERELMFQNYLLITN